MINYTKEQVVERFEDEEKAAPQWVIDAPDDAIFAVGQTCDRSTGRWGHMPLHIVDGPRPELQNIISIALEAEE